MSKETFEWLNTMTLSRHDKENMMATQPNLGASRTAHIAEDTDPTPATCSTRVVCPNCQHTEMSPDDEREQCGECDPDGLNSAAEFAPQAEPFTRPCLTVAGAQVYAYIDDRGCYVLSVDLDTAQLHYGNNTDTDARVPIRVKVGDEVLAQRYPDSGCWCVYRTHDGTQNDGIREDSDDTVTTLLWRDEDCLEHDAVTEVGDSSAR